MTKKTVLFTLLIAVILYLMAGFAFYINDVRYSRSIHLCPPDTIVVEPGGYCPPQTISLKQDWPTAVTLTIGWLPLLIMQAVDG